MTGDDARVAPSPAMLRPVERIVGFMETLDPTALEGAFADGPDVVVIDSFPPFVFTGRGAGERWGAGFRAHAADHAGLRHEFGPAQEFSVSGDTGFFSLPITWRWESGGVEHRETGGLAVVVVGDGDEFRVRSTGWAVVTYE